MDEHDIATQRLAQVARTLRLINFKLMQLRQTNDQLLAGLQDLLGQTHLLAPSRRAFAPFDRSGTHGVGTDRGLERRTERHVRRAVALLAVDERGVYAHAAQESGLRSITTVADLVARFNRHGLAAIRIARGRGRKPTYQAAERAQMVATAQGEPDRRIEGTGTWSLSTLQHTLRQTGLPHVGTSTIRRVLQDAGSSY
jgi:transposase